MDKRTVKQKQYYEEVIRLHFEEGCSTERIAQILPLGHTTVWRWISNFAARNEREEMKGKTKEGDSQIVENQDVEHLKKELARVYLELKRERMRADGLDRMIDIAEENFKIPIRKKAGAKQ